MQSQHRQRAMRFAQLVGRFDSARSKEKPQARRAAHHSSTLPCGTRRFTARYHEGEMICHWFSPYDGGSTTPSFAEKEATFSPSGMMARTFNDSVFASVMAQLFLAFS